MKNHTELEGEINDALLKYVGAGGVALCTFTLTTRFGRSDAKTAIVQCKAWQELAEELAIIPAGSVVSVEGRLTQDTWEWQGKQYSKLMLEVQKVVGVQGEQPELVPVEPKDNRVLAGPVPRNTDPAPEGPIDDDDIPF